MSSSQLPNGGPLMKKFSKLKKVLKNIEKK
jgi:hypothetical protein